MKPLAAATLFFAALLQVTRVCAEDSKPSEFGSGSKEITQGISDIKNKFGADGGNTECRLRREYAERVISSGALTPEELLLRASGSDAKILVLSENHYKRPAEFLGGLLERLHSSDPGFNCLLMETDRSCGPLTDDILSGRKTFEEASAAAKDPCHFYRHDPPLLTSAARAGMKVFDVDDQSQDSAAADVASVMATFPFRNAAMARTANALLRGGTCDKAILLVGNAHAEAADLNPAEPGKWASVPTLLRAGGVKTSVVKVLSRASREREDSNSYLVSTRCKWDLWTSLPTGAEPFGFLPVKPSPAAFDAKSPVADGRIEVRWDEFQGILVIP